MFFLDYYACRGGASKILSTSSREARAKKLALRLPNSTSVRGRRALLLKYASSNLKHLKLPLSRVIESGQLFVVRFTFLAL